ncbi:Crp/Fnr family transcriptional regulator (plasmid) [Microvirga ossetica]|uniref:Crp/Fnr family transcriptional regulator n=1 Tax=Microvirga ossetica TaxID=1882682 RepID=A0A1B2EZ59_9HYPH|nr:Crp/Fnr family transcriptional regulator [Microvirga ossetica]ANY85233.1 Crp/Fnr family transcriptional regulator [Microvirga ossetica]
MKPDIYALAPAPKVDHRTNRLLAALDSDDFAALEPHLHGVSLQQDQVLYEAGDPLRHAFFPHDTVVSLVAVLKDGRSAEMAVYGREGALGLVSSMTALQSFGRYIVQADGTASRIELERLQEVIGTRPKVRQLVLNFAEAMMARVLQNVACNAVHSVEARCCRWILSMHDRLDRDAVPLTHEFLADMLGVQRSTVSSIARALQEAGLIRQGRGVITVMDRAGLEQTSCECYGTVRRSFERLLPHTYRNNPTPDLRQPRRGS